MTEVGPIVPEGTAAQRMKPKPQQELTPETQAELEKFRATASKIATVEPTDLNPRVPPSVETVAADCLLPEILKSVVIKIWDGREIELGPPTVSVVLVVPKMFNNRSDEGLQLLAEMNLAKKFQYIRRIGGQRMPGYIATWQEVVELIHELGDLGVRAVAEAYDQYFPEYSGSTWAEVKKNVLRPVVSTDGGAG